MFGRAEEEIYLNVGSDGSDDVSRVFVSWWWLAIAVAALVVWGGTFPSDPVVEPGMPRVAFAMLVIGGVMLLMSGGAWAWRIGRRDRK